MMWIVCSFLLVICSYDEVAARNSFEEKCHIITTSAHDFLAVIYVLFSYRSHCRFVHNLCHTWVVHARRATIDHFYMACATHRSCYARRYLPDTAYQFLAVFRSKGTYGAIHLCGFRDNIESRSCLNPTDGNDGGSEWRGLTANQRLKGRDNVRCDDDWVDRRLRLGSVSTFAFDGQNKPISAGKGGA